MPWHLHSQPLLLLRSSTMLSEEKKNINENPKHSLQMDSNSTLFHSTCIKTIYEISTMSRHCSKYYFIYILEKWDIDVCVYICVKYICIYITYLILGGENLFLTFRKAGWACGSVEDRWILTIEEKVYFEKVGFDVDILHLIYKTVCTISQIGYAAS